MKAKIIGFITTIIVALAVLIGGGFGKILGPSLFNKLTSNTTTTSAYKAPDQLEQQLRLAAEKINKSTPYHVDQYTRLDRAAANATILTYYYTFLGNSSQEIIAGDPQQSVTQKVCKTNTSRSILNMGGAFQYVYRDRHGIEFANFSVTSQGCSRY